MEDNRAVRSVAVVTKVVAVVNAFGDLERITKGQILEDFFRDCTHMIISRLVGGWSLKIYPYDNIGGSGSELGKF